MFTWLHIGNEACELCAKDEPRYGRLCLSCAEMILRIESWMLADLPSVAQNADCQRLLPPGRARDLTDESDRVKAAAVGTVGSIERGLYPLINPLRWVSP